jgi:hypothetical protein
MILFILSAGCWLLATLHSYMSRISINFCKYVYLNAIHCSDSKMLLSKQELVSIAEIYKKPIKSILHIGLFETQDESYYSLLSVTPVLLIPDDVVFAAAPASATSRYQTFKPGADFDRHISSIHEPYSLVVIKNGAADHFDQIKTMADFVMTEEALPFTEAGFSRIRKSLYVRKVLPKLTVCIPTYKRWTFLQENLPKYAENPYIDEIVLSDEDGSDARNVYYSDIDQQKIRIFSNSKRLGPFLNKQAAVGRARNAWISLMDSDNFAPISYFDAWGAAFAPDDKLFYAPSRTLPTEGHGGFDFRNLSDMIVSANNFKQFFKLHCADICLNTGNYIVNKSTFLKAICSVGDNDCHARDVLYQNYLLFHLAGAKMKVVPHMAYNHIVHQGSYYIQHNDKTHVEYFNSLYENHPEFVMTLAEWQRRIKPRSEFLYNCSEPKGENDEWVRFPIGMGWAIINCEDDSKLQIGDHENLVHCAIADWTDERRRPVAPNRKAFLKTLESLGISNKLLPHNSYFESLPHYKFVISPEGNGIDCHRHYEALMAGAIPIVEDHPGIREKYVGCPVLFTKDYSELTPSYLTEVYNRMINQTFDFSRLMLSTYDPKTVAQIKAYGDYWCRKVTGRTWYENRKEEFDIVIPLGPYDHDRIRQGLPYNLKNVVGRRKVFIISPSADIPKIKDLESADVTIIDENIFPFSLDSMTSYIGPIKRRGWYLQQLLKLYAGFVIPGILRNWLVIDADTMFLRPTVFFHDGRAAFNVAVENREIYFDHMAKLHPSLRRVDPRFSGITHHMMFDTKFVRHLFELVETNHSNKPFWRVFMENIIPSEFEGAGASEYEMYFNFMAIHHPDALVVRPLRMANMAFADTSLDVDYISVHDWLYQEALKERMVSK